MDGKGRIGGDDVTRVENDALHEGGGGRGAEEILECDRRWRDCGAKSAAGRAPARVEKEKLVTAGLARDDKSFTRRRLESGDHHIAGADRRGESRTAARATRARKRHRIKRKRLAGLHEVLMCQGLNGDGRDVDGRGSRQAVVSECECSHEYKAEVIFE